MHDVEVPTIGESVTSGLLTTWLKNDGEYVNEGDDLFELETDKATMAVPAPVSGVVKTRVAQDAEVEVGQVVASIDTDAEAPADAGDKAPGGSDEQSESGGQPESVAEGKRDAPAEQTDDLAPAVRRLVEEHRLNPAEITGSGKGGRLTKGDVVAHLEQQADKDEQAKGSSAGRPREQRSQAPAAPRSGERQTRTPMSNLRKTIARHLVEAKQNAAHLTTFNEVDMSIVMGLRRAYREAFEERHGVRLGFMSFFVKASVRALKDFPSVNAAIDGNEIVHNNYYDIGVAVSTERGLVVPVIRDADTLGYADIEKTIGDLASRARDRKLSVDEMTGGTFTITNGGVFGSLLSTPIPNPPQTGVLGMHTIQKRPVVVDDQIVIRPMMYLALTYDHRLIDGREAVSFLVRIKKLVEDPNQMLLDL